MFKYVQIIMCQILRTYRASYVLLDRTSKFALFSVSGLKDEKLIKKGNLQKNWNMQTLF